MKEQPILFRSPMVRAILAGRKTQTRRLMKPHPSEGFYPSACVRYHPAIEDKDGYQSEGPAIFGCYDKNGEEEGYKCKYEPGLRLWVKETFRAVERESDSVDGVLYAADNSFHPIENTRKAAEKWIDTYNNGKHGDHWRPSIYMPRWASRITLEIESVRVERLQDISESDAIEEGITWDEWSHDYIGAYRKLWESINGPGSWDSNPFVWVIGFRKL